MVTILISNSINFGSKIVIKSLLLCCWEMSTPVDALFFVNFATVLNKYLGLCLFCSKRDEK